MFEPEPELVLEFWFPEVEFDGAGASPREARSASVSGSSRSGFTEVWGAAPVEAAVDV